MSIKLKTLLSIAGSDPMGGAGIQADIRVGLSLGVHVMTAVTSVTAQNSKEFIEMGPVRSDLLKLQLKAIQQDILPDAVKIGMIGTVDNLMVISGYLSQLPKDIPIILDPVLKISSDSSATYHEKDFIDCYKKFILPFATVITPNLEENIFPKHGAVIIKGGHNNDTIIEDILIMNDLRFICRHKRIDCQNLHGTGCVFSSLLSCYLALGNTIRESFEKTVDSMDKIIRRSCEYKLGTSDYGPLNINNYRL